MFIISLVGPRTTPLQPAYVQPRWVMIPGMVRTLA